LVISARSILQSVRVAALLGLAFSPWAAAAQDDAEPVQTPFLMVDTAMHVGPIWRISLDASGTLLATVAGDKSIRLFDVASGNLLRKIHLPLGDGEIGSVVSVALSPDGRLLLAATLSFDTGTDFDSGSVYVVDVQDGQIRGRLRNLPAVPTRIAFAPDGRHFVLVMEDAGVQLRTAGGRCVWPAGAACGRTPTRYASSRSDGPRSPMTAASPPCHAPAS
jgi:WD40 repeat protein